jgi:hypothetical protein
VIVRVIWRGGRVEDDPTKDKREHAENMNVDGHEARTKRTRMSVIHLDLVMKSYARTFTNSTEDLEPLDWHPYLLNWWRNGQISL